MEYQLNETLNESDKEKRIRNTKNKINKQLKIAKQHNITVTTPHKYHKHNVINCGNPKCILCQNPRKIWKQKTLQEKRFLQDEGE